ncbi:NAD(P)/FAD-dependent oxidoreductase [Microbacterium sp. C7(2022)]|uniref:protoporphyrinogen/coproporphyrinogen oxidase n=1 Tax=Microbacterium sp. C7(2022) TaxID=2992759 RepID=UPI00237B2A2A|nr:FAD-dependent oxidoreductase [Microbacterium sp. C7(2022)]MDE0546539.1 FAD-dependent oxidoreductase [Microbacterium sp. C7(2022)]
MVHTGDSFDDLVSHARDAHVAVIGGGIAGLVAAHEFAKVGIATTVFEASPRLGGVIRGAELGGITVDVGATSWRADSEAVNSLISELGLQDCVCAPVVDTTWICDPAQGWAAPSPQESVLGIPANPWDESVRRIIGWGGTWRAYLDRLRPPMTIGVARNLGSLVRSRMGAKVHDRLVAPLTFGRFGISPDDVDVDVAAPGLNGALTRTGSLSGAVSDLRVDHRTAGLSSLEGGMLQLVTALEQRLRDLGARIHTSTTVSGVSRTADGRWRVEFDAESGDAELVDGDEPVGSTSLTASAVVLAGSRESTERLTRSILPRPLEPAMHPAVLREIVTMLVDAPALDAAPRGAEVYAVPGETGATTASGVVHQSARWEWLRRAAGESRHVISVAFDGSADAHPSLVRGDGDLAEFARGAASDLLGVSLDARHVIAWRRDLFTLERPSTARGHAEESARDRRLVQGAGTLSVVGAWVAGSGLAKVAADAVEEADRVRRTLLWGAEGAS